ncbi:hypothetical protein FZEAL_4045 [Fusarium zealandicum]|uniref:Uncharacterized protein n=1 Tax=Fusarium zealandicum TaxID=1053134 RepID=A0A8H4XLZ7_9HYPO|nr:hypothetical protein FZEAL_4045 [Fusarium zealandicum]
MGKPHQTTSANLPHMSIFGMALCRATIAAGFDPYESSAMGLSSAYPISMSSLTPVAGCLAIIFPPQVLVLPIAALVAADSWLWVLATSFADFVVERLAAGVGGAVVLTLAVILGLKLTSERTRGLAMGLDLGRVVRGSCVCGGLVPAELWIATIVRFFHSLADEIKAFLLSTLLLFLAVEHQVAVVPIIPVKALYLHDGASCSTRQSSCSPSASVDSILVPTNIGFGVLAGWLHVRGSDAFWLPSVASLVLFSLSLYARSLTGTPELLVVLFILVVLVNGLAIGGGPDYTLAHTLHLGHDDIRYGAANLLATFRGFGGSSGTAIGWWLWLFHRLPKVL